MDAHAINTALLLHNTPPAPTAPACPTAVPSWRSSPAGCRSPAPAQRRSRSNQHTTGSRPLPAAADTEPPPPTAAWLQGRDRRRGWGWVGGWVRLRMGLGLEGAAGQGRAARHAGWQQHARNTSPALTSTSTHLLPPGPGPQAPCWLPWSGGRCREQRRRPAPLRCTAPLWKTPWLTGR